MPSKVVQWIWDDHKFKPHISEMHIKCSCKRKIMPQFLAKLNKTSLYMYVKTLDHLYSFWARCSRILGGSVFKMIPQVV